MPDLILSTNSSGALKTNLIHIAVDEVTYDTGGQWPPWAHGGGSSLELIHPFSNHRLANNWADSDETAKAPWTTIQAYGPMDNGSGTANAVEGGLQEEGECLLDDVEVIAGTTGPNLVANPGFESGAGSWVMRGNHVRSSVETGTGFGGGRSLHVRASSRCDYGPNRIYSPLTSVPGGNVTIRAKVRWLKGWPEMLLRLHGNYFEVASRLTVPGNLGTPGARNSRAVNNAPPAIYEVTHSPVLPAGGQAVVVTARVHDAGGIASAALKYRVDPNTTYTTVTMVDTGVGSDAIAGDGLYSASIPAQSSGALVAFMVTATDSAGSARLYPTNSPANGRMRECLVRFGDPTTFSGFGTYRMWFTQGTVNDWINRPVMSNEPEEGTFVYGNFRAIHSFGCRYAGSPWHQGWGSPLSDTHYTASMPADNLLLGTTGFNKIHAPGNGPFDDDSLQREQTGNWIARQLHIPWTYRRFVNVYVNGDLRRPGALMEDMQIPDPDFIEEYWPDDHDGSLHKTQGWYEMDDAATGAMPNTGLAAWCSLDRFTTTIDGVTQYKLARYRWNWFSRAINRTANDYSEVFRLVEAINTTPGPALTANMLALADVEEWMRAWAVRHLLGDWDFYGGPNGQNAYAYKPENGKWNVFLFDMNIIIGNGSSAPGDGLFSIGDGNLTRLYNHPPFRRMYFRALKEICTGPIVEANLSPLLDAKYAAFQASGINPASPAGIKSWLAQARTIVLGTVAAEDASSFSVNGGNSLVTDANLITLSGRAPVEVKTIQINGVDWSPTWTSVADWTLQLPVSAATNLLAICGYDIYGKLVAGASNALTVVYTRPVPSPVGNLFISEIMYAPAVSNAAYVEICNRSTNFTFDLSGWRLQGVDFTFPEGALIAPGAFLVVVENRAQFVAAYGSSPRIAGEYAGRLDRDGEALRLIQPGAGSEPDLVVSEVRYDQNLPWPIDASGAGPSLQLVDAAQDIRRVCNWGVGDTNVAPQPEPEWVYVTATGSASSSLLYIYLDSAGEVYLDDLKLVMGSVPEAGANMIQNGILNPP